MIESNTDISDFKLAGKPTEVDQLSVSAPLHVLEAFDTLSSWGTEAIINKNGSSLLIGGLTDDKTTGYRLYHNPSVGKRVEFAGVLVHRHSYTDDPADQVGFKPTGEDKSETESEVIPVTSLEVTNHDRTERLDTLLPHIRTEITDSDWVNGRGDTSYPEWGQAVRRMAEFMRDDLETDLAFDRQMLRYPRVEHALGRYPLDSDSTLTQLSNTIDQKDELDHYDVSPEAFRELLFEFAVHHNLPSDGK